jgi:hypothetical protein
VPQFQADTDKIDDAAGRVGGVGRALAESYGGFSPGALGFPSAISALEDFTSRWGQARAVLTSTLSGLGTAVTTAVAAYNKVEQTNADTANACIARRP